MHKTLRWTLVAIGVSAASLVLAAAGCATKTAARPDDPAATTAEMPAGEVAQAAAAPRKTGVQLWADHCARCHNARPPDWRSKADREVSVHHMAVRVPMTGEDEREIIKFLASQ